MSDVDISPKSIKRDVADLRTAASSVGEAIMVLTAGDLLRTAAKFETLLTELTATQEKLALSKQANEILVERLKNAGAKLTAPVRDDAWALRLVAFSGDDSNWLHANEQEPGEARITYRMRNTKEVFAAFNTQDTSNE